MSTGSGQDKDAGSAPAEVKEAIDKIVQTQNEFLAKLVKANEDFTAYARRCMAAQGDYMSDLSRCRDMDDVARASSTFLTRMTNEYTTEVNHLAGDAKDWLRKR